MGRLIGLVAVAVLIPVGVSGADAVERAAGERLHDKVVTVGSFDFAESRLLAELRSLRRGLRDNQESPREGGPQLTLGQRIADAERAIQLI